MSAASDGSFISYDGNAVLWQGANRLHGDRVEIDRKAGSLMSTGNVLSRFRNQRSGPESAEGARVEVETVVRAREMNYFEESRSARYNGDVRLNQPGLDITSRELTAFFKDGDDGVSTSLDHALADGDVRITQTDEERVRTGLAEHAEYHLDEEKVILSGGRPQMIDSLRGATQGNQLTYYSRNDRLLVDGADTRPAVSKIRKN
jgi:lipopolysaccharide export system protein LptA